MTETGYDSAGPFGTTEAIQAARLPRVVMLCLANGVEKVFVYRESGSTPSMHACSGILRNDFSRKPSWYTLRTMIRQLQGVGGGARRMPHPDQNVWLLEWDTGGKPLLTAWTVDGEARLGIDLGGCKVTDSFGGLAPLPNTAELADHALSPVLPRLLEHGTPGEIACGAPAPRGCPNRAAREDCVASQIPVRFWLAGTCGAQQH